MYINTKFHQNDKNLNLKIKIHSFKAAFRGENLNNFLTDFT